MLRFILITSILSLYPSVGNAQSDTHRNCLRIHQNYIEKAFELTKNCVGFSAPVSGRAYGYISVGMYEATVDLLQNKKSLVGQLNGYERDVELPASLNWEIAVNAADYHLINYFYRNMPPSQKANLDSLYNTQKTFFSKRVNHKTRRASEAYGVQIANAIINWSKTDGAENGHLQNFSENFEIIKCESCWVRTFPGYLPALTPYWGNNRPMLRETPEVYSEMKIFNFDTVPGSKMYQEALKVYRNGIDSNVIYEKIAEYWDDGVGYSGTPSGHFFTIAQNISKTESLKLADHCFICMNSSSSG